jgi:preprotein translocase SecE subunit
LAGPHPVKGLRGGIFWSILTIFTGLFLLRWALSTVERMSKNFEIGQFLSLAVVGFFLYLFWKYLRSDRMTRWAVKFEEAGWFDAKSYKRNQGIRVRRGTIIGLLLLFGSGIYTMLHNRVVGDNAWVVSIPFADTSATLLPHLEYTVPVILGLLAIWFAWRVVNFPVFADFLIATEAEINKVSWTPRARLIQDTIVVLVTVLIITTFLFFVDGFWGWFLSRRIVNVLPNADDLSNNQSKQVNTNEW